MPKPSPTAPLLQLHDAARYFDVSRPWLNRVIERQPRQILKAVDGVSFAISHGETLSLVGESGCGKSTVARLVVGLYGLTRGRIVFEGIELGSLRTRADWAPLRRRMQMIFQDPYASLNSRWRVADIIAEPIRAHALAQGPTVQQRVADLLRQVGLAVADGRKYPHEFSGGQRQRISIARALASEPEFLVCDEPTSALDVSVQAQILNLMQDLQRDKNLTYLFISHNLAVVRHLADRVAVMYLGRLVELAATQALFTGPQHPYTRMLLDVVPRLEDAGRGGNGREKPVAARVPVAGEAPNPLQPPTGCAFHPRCPFASERCRQEVPALMLTPAGGEAACHAVEEGRLPAYRPENG